MRNSFIGSFMGFMCAALVVAACGGGGGGPLPALTIPEAEERFEELEAEIVALQDEVVTLTEALASNQEADDGQQAAIDGLDARVTANEESIATLETEVGDLQTDVDDVTTDVSDLSSDLDDLSDAVDALTPLGLKKHTSDEFDNLTLPSDIANGLPSDTDTHIKKLTFTPENAHDGIMAVRVEGDLTIDDVSDELTIMFHVAATGDGTTWEWADYQDFDTTGEHDFSLTMKRGYEWWREPPTSYTLTLLVHDGSSDLDATLDNLVFTIWTVEGETITVAGSGLFT